MAVESGVSEFGKQFQAVTGSVVEALPWILPALGPLAPSLELTGSQGQCLALQAARGRCLSVAERPCQRHWSEWFWGQQLFLSMTAF